VQLGGNAGEVAFSIVGTALTGWSPLNTRQLLLMNMLTDALTAAALAVSRPASSPSPERRGPDQAELWRTVGVRGVTTAAAATAAWGLASITGRQRRASTVALVALVATQLGQTLIDSHSPLVVGTAAGTMLAMGKVISTPVVSQLLGGTWLGPAGWAQALTTAGAATAVAAVAPKLFGRADPEPDDQASTWTTPTRNNTAYSSRNGNASNPATASVNGSAPTDTDKPDTTATVRVPGVQTANST
jgi:cation-transporting P-type ATPase I